MDALFEVPWVPLRPDDRVENWSSARSRDGTKGSPLNVPHTGAVLV
jgi:hypothetical protein